MKKVLITDSVHHLLIEGLEKAGFECFYYPDISLDDVVSSIGLYSGLIINSKIIVDKNFLDKAKKLEFIGRLGSGLEIIDLEYANKKGIRVLRSPEGNRNAVAEHALGMLLALANKLVSADGEVRNKYWNRERNRGFEILGKTIGIIGFGNVGNKFSEKLKGMGVKILAYDKYKKYYAEDIPYVKEVAMDVILKNADIISLHVPLTEETYHWVDADFISKCKNGVIIINTSRGKVLKTGDLIRGLESRKIAGACIDVFENEKPETFNESEVKLYEKLYAMKNIILSPHVAGWTIESKRRLSEILLHKIMK